MAYNGRSEEFMSEIFSPTNLGVLMMLILLQAVLGFDNLLYISIESKKVVPEKQSMVRRGTPPRYTAKPISYPLVQLWSVGTRPKLQAACWLRHRTKQAERLDTSQQQLTAWRVNKMVL